MKPSNRKSILSLLGVAILLVPTLARAQQEIPDLERLPKVGVIRGIHSIDQSHLAVWYWSNKEDPVKSDGNILVIYEIRNRQFLEVFRLQAGVDGSWTKLEPLFDTRLIGIKIESGILTNYDSATVVALVDGKFQTVFEGSTSEFRDLNEDGIPELFESEWPDGDGYPTTTTVHCWNGQTYKRLMKVAYRKRFGSVVQTALAKRRTPR